MIARGNLSVKINHFVTKLMLTKACRSSAAKEVNCVWQLQFASWSLKYLSLRVLIVILRTSTSGLLCLKLRASSLFSNFGIYVSLNNSAYIVSNVILSLSDKINIHMTMTLHPVELGSNIVMTLRTFVTRSDRCRALKDPKGSYWSSYQG